MSDIKNRSGSSAGFLGSSFFRLFRFFFMILMTFIILYPVLYMVSMAFRTTEDVYDVTVVWVPKHFSFESFKVLYNDLGIVKPLFNSFWITFLSSFLQVMTVAVTGYGFARFKFRGRGLLLAFLIFSIVVPPQMIAMPTYLSFSHFDIFGILKSTLGDTVSILGNPAIFPALAILGQGIRASLFILIIYQYYKALPGELEEAALIDGCGYWKCFFAIILPSALTQLFIIFLFSVVWYWNDYYFSSVYLGGASTFPVKLSNIRALLENSEGLMNASHNSYQIAIYEQAGCLLIIIPMVILYVFLQRFFVEGLEKTGLVG